MGKIHYDNLLTRELLLFDCCKSFGSIFMMKVMNNTTMLSVGHLTKHVVVLQDQYGYNDAGLWNVSQYGYPAPAPGPRHAHLRVPADQQQQLLRRERGPGGPEDILW